MQSRAKQQDPRSDRDAGADPFLHWNMSPHHIAPIGRDSRTLSAKQAHAPPGLDFKSVVAAIAEDGGGHLLVPAGKKIQNFCREFRRLHPR